MIKCMLHMLKVKCNPNFIPCYKWQMIYSRTEVDLTCCFKEMKQKRLLYKISDTWPCTSSASRDIFAHSPFIKFQPVIFMAICASTIVLTILSAIALTHISTNFILDHSSNCNDFFFNPSFVSLYKCFVDIASSHRRRPNVPLQSVCDSFPPGIPPPDTDITTFLCVDRNGCCNFTTVQAAVNAVANFSQKRTVIWINNGIYLEKVSIPMTKQNVTLQGQGYTTTAIAWNDTAKSANGTFYSASVAVFGGNFIAKNISFMNLAPMPQPGDVGAQAVAIRVGGDQSAFWGCGFFGAQDTLHDDKGRHYFKECFIQGSIDFIFGNGRSLYENCTVISIAKPVPAGAKVINGVVTAHGRSLGEDNTGFSFVNCFIGGTGRIWLGRAWRPFARVIFAYTYMSEIIASEGWNDFNSVDRDQTVFFGEYRCSGPGSNATLRVSYSQRLNDTQITPFLNTSYIDGDQWLQPFNIITPKNLCTVT